LEQRNYFFIAIFLTVGVGVGSLISLNHESIPKLDISDKLIHISAYLLISISWLLSFKEKAKTLKVNSLIFISIFAYGIIIEIFQGVFTSYRQFDYFDILANLVGIIVAFTIFFKSFQKIHIK